MSPRTDLKSRIARALAAHAVLVAEAGHAEWTRAMIHEQEHLPAEASALSWALGCVFVSYRARLRAMTKLPDLPPWALALMVLLGPVPPCVNFIQVVVSTAQGHPLFWASALPLTVMQEALIFGSATLIGPLAFVATLWTLSSPAHRPGRLFIVVLWALTAWATIYVGLPAHYGLLAHATSHEIFTLLFNFVLLPAVAVAGLQSLDARRRPHA